MNQDEFSRAVEKRFAKGPLHHDQVPDKVQHAIMGIVTEAGELADAMKRGLAYNKPLDLDNIKEELGDSLFYIVALANYYGWTLKDIMIENDAKLEKRYPRGFTTEDALARADKVGEAA